MPRTSSEAHASPTPAPPPPKAPATEISVSPIWEAKFARPCGICREKMENGVEAVFIKNDRTGKKLAAHLGCAAKKGFTPPSIEGPSLEDVLSGA